MWRFAPLYACLWIADRLASKKPTPRPHRGWDRAEVPGVSIVIAERGTPDLLHQTLCALLEACSQIDEPFEIIVRVNGVDASGYSVLEERFASAIWSYAKEPLGYSRAIQTALDLVQYDWCYLLNSDMVLAPDALKQVLAVRRPDVFAIASQIFFINKLRRREETGWTDFHTRNGYPEIFDRTPEPGNLVRAHLYAGGGSSLYRTKLLRRYASEARDYSPFYWEDADWGVRAWAEGWQVLFCPESHAHHHHRSTIGKYYSGAEIDRILRRNAVLFDLRNCLSGEPAGTQLHRIATLPKESRQELSDIGLALRAMKARLATNQARARGLEYHGLWHSGANIESCSKRPRVLLASPFALYPPAHGGARRIAELIERLSESFDIILLSDERSSYDEQSKKWFSRLCAVHLVEGRGDKKDQVPQSIADRINRHAWPGLRLQLRRLIALYSPDIVQVEFVELARLVEERDSHSRWLLTLHDVELPPSTAGTSLHNLLQRYDRIIACTDEDRDQLAPLPTSLVANGARDRRAIASKSPENHLLFLGPFRYAPNRTGILAFLDLCWPELKRRFPPLRLTILCATSDSALIKDHRFTQDGVELRCTYEDPSIWLERCSLTINPLTSVLGSSVKLIESLLSRRICVSTRDGARGFLESRFGGLIVAPDIASMTAPIATLLETSELRHNCESSDLGRLDHFTWKQAATDLNAVYTTLLEL